jgi:SAM-dependent methyltransferase
MKSTPNVYPKTFLQMSSYKTLDVCRICGGSFSEDSLELSKTGLANELFLDQKSAMNAERFPLTVVMCEDCKHFQLKHIVNPKRLFSDYIYRTGMSTFFQSHFESLAERIVEMFNYKLPKVFEVGSNDGLLLYSLKAKGIVAYGLEPSKALVDECNSRGLNVIHGFLDSETVTNAKSRWGNFDVVVGNNVFAHIDDLYSSFLNVNELLVNNGLFIFEVADFLQIRKKGIFDSIYHEHMSYHTLSGLEFLAKRTKFTIVDFEYVNSHGGSFRFILKKGGSHAQRKTVQERRFYEVKEGLTSASVLLHIRKMIDSQKREVAQFLDTSDKFDILIGYGAPAKAVTFMSEMGLNHIGIKGVIDDNVWKQKKYLPVSGIQIISKEDAMYILNQQSKRTGVNFLVFPWNLSSELLVKLKQWVPKKSKAICFFPSLEVIKL